MRNGAIHILLVEEERNHSETIKQIIEKTADKDLNFEHAESLSSALERLSHEDIDVILLDLFLPEGNGIEAFLRLNAAYPYIPVVVLTDQMDDGSDLEVIQKGAQDYLHKAELLPSSLVRSIRYAALRKRAQEEIRRSHDKLQALFKGIPIPTYIWKREVDDFVLTDYNDAAVTITDGMISAYVGRLASMMYRDNVEIIGDMKRCFLERTTINKEMRYHFTSTGEDRYLEVRYGFAPPDLVLVHTVDITERKKAQELLQKSHDELDTKVTERTTLLAQLNERLIQEVDERKQIEEALKESERKYRYVVENVGEAIVVVQTDRVVFANPKAFEPIGYTYEELTSIPFMTLVHPEDKERVLDYHRKGLAGENPLPITYRLIDKHGQIRWIEINGVLIMWDGLPSGLLFIHEVTDRKKAEDALRESEEKYRLVVENANEGIGILQDEVIKFVNPKLCEISGYSSKEMISRPFVEFLHHEEHEVALSRHHQKLDGKDIDLPFPYRFITGEGSIRWIELSSILVSWQASPAVLVFVSDVTERKLQEDALRESEKRYRELVEKTGDLIYVVDGEGHFKLINQTIEREYGYTAPDLVGKEFKDIITPESYKSTVEGFSRQLKGIDIGNFELDIYDKDGNIRTIETRERLVWEGKRVVEVHGIARDVTARKQAEAALRDSEEKYRSLVENLNEVICSTDLEGIVTYISPAVEQVTGYTVEEVIGQPITNYIYPEDIAGFLKSHKRTLTGKKEPYEFRAIHRSGDIIHVRTFSRQQFHGDKLIGLTGTITDISERVRAADALRESEEKYRIVVENAEEVITIAVGNYLKFANRKALESSGYSEEEALSIPVIEMIHPDDRKMVIGYRKRRDKGDKEPQSFMMRLLKKDGQSVWLRSSVVPIVWRGENAALNIATDVTEQKKIEDALKESEKKYRMVVENAEEIITVTVDGYAKFVNKRTVELSGYSEEELTSSPVLEFVHPEDRHLVIEHRVKRNKGEKEPQRFVMRLVTKNGNVLWTENSIVPVIWQGKPAALNIATDITEKRRTGEALKDSEEKYRLVVENAGEGITITQDGIIRFINPIIARRLGYSAEEFISRPFTEFLHPEDRQTVLNHHKRRIEHTETYDVFEFRAITKSGDLVWVENNGVLIDWEGRPAILAFLRDITEEKKIEDQLKESEEKYRIVVENANEIIVISQDGIVKFANNRVRTLFGVPPETLVGRHLSDLVVNADREKLREEYRKLTSREATLPLYRFRMRDSRGNIRHIEVSGIDVTWDGQPSILSFVSDITERVRVERALQESEEFTRGLLVNAPLGIFYLDMEGKIIYENPASLAITSGQYDSTQPPRELGMNIFDLPVVKKLPDSKNEIQELLSGKSITNYIIPFRSLDGRRMMLSIYGSPRFSSEGHQIGAVVMFADITDKVRAEEEIARRLRYEEAVAFCSQELVSSTDLTTSLPLIVEKLHTIVEVSSLFIRKNFEDPRKGMCTRTIYQAVPRGFQLLKEDPAPQSIPYAELSPELWDSLNRGLPYGGQARNLSKSERDRLGELGILSGMLFPIHAEDRFWGFIGFDDLSTERAWSNEDIFLLQTVSSIIGTAVTRREAEIALADSEQQYRELVDSTNDIIYVTSDKGDFKFVNNAVRQLGYEPDEVIGRNIYEFYASSSKKYALELFRLQRSGAQLEGYELDIVNREGQIRTIEFREKGIWEGNRIVEFRGIGRDVTERRKRDNRLRLIAESQEAILNSFTEMVFFTDPTLKITWANQATSRDTRLTIEELVGRHCYEVLHDSQEPCQWCPAIVSLNTGRIEKTDGIIYHGKKRHAVGYPVFDTEGNVTGAAVSVGDATSNRILDITRSLSVMDEQFDEYTEGDLFMAPLDPNYIYPFNVLIDYQKDSFIINLRWDEYGKVFSLKRLARSESAVARFVFLAARMKADGRGWVDKDLIKAGTMDTNLNKLRSILEQSSIPFLDRFSSRMLIRSNKEEKKKVRLAIAPSNIEISASIKDFESKKHRYLAAITKKVKKLKKEIEGDQKPKDYLINELAIQRQNALNLRKNIDVVESLISESVKILNLLAVLFIWARLDTIDPHLFHLG